MKNKVEDLIGKRFGRLMVIERAQDYVSRKGRRQGNGNAYAIAEIKPL